VSPEVPALDLDPYAAEFLADPYPGHERIREAGPVVRLEGEVLLGALARRVRALEPEGAAVVHLNNTLRGWSRLPVRLVPA
jgi:cytochrome P450